MEQNRLLRIRDVQQRVSLGRSTIWLWIKQKRFPSGFKLSNSVRVWHERDINDFVEGKWNEQK
ncbi:AlpA family phage regulatory protein [Sulfuricurvum sp.]|uniref:helix-turn-helix transcriptional regulator n=1 Tax=Sulfuricurvum sp. TaxID=2025608 RepID=UPI0034528F3D